MEFSAYLAPNKIRRRFSAGWDPLNFFVPQNFGPSWYGPGLSRVQQTSQISLWSIILSPLMVSVDERFLTKADFCYKLITNPLLVSIHQDPLWLPGGRIKNTDVYSEYNNNNKNNNNNENDNDNDDDDDDRSEKVVVNRNEVSNCWHGRYNTAMLLSCFWIVQIHRKYQAGKRGDGGGGGSKIIIIVFVINKLNRGRISPFR